MNTENKPVYFTKDQLKQHLEARGINTNAKAQPIIDQLVKKGAVIEGYNDQPKPNAAQSITGGLIKAPTDLIGAGFAGAGALGKYIGQNLGNKLGTNEGGAISLADAYKQQSQQVQESGANTIVEPLTGEKIRPAQNLKELGGDVLQTAAIAIPGGSLGKGLGAVGKIAEGAGLGALAGGSYAAGSAMSKDATLEDIIKEGLYGAAIGGTLGGAIPAIPSVYNAVKKAPALAEDAFASAKNLRSSIQSYVGEKSVQPQFGTAATRLTESAKRLESPLMTYEKYLPQAQKAIIDTKADAPISIVGSEIGDAFKKVVENRRAVGAVMGQELKTVGKLKTDIEPIFVNFETALSEAGLTYNGLKKKIVASDLSKVAPEDIAVIEDFVNDLNKIGIKPSVAQIDALISRVTDKINYAKSAKGMTSTTNGERLVKATLNSLRNKFDEIPELAKYAEARKTYADLSNFIEEGAGFLGKLTQSGDFAKDASIAKSAVQSILNNGKKDWLLKLEALTDYPALDESTLALQAMKDAGDFRGLSILETLSEGTIPTSKAGFTQKLLDFLVEKGSNVVTGSAPERTRAYLKSLETTLKKEAEKNININTTTPKTGLMKNPTNKGIKKSAMVMSDTIPQAEKVASKKMGGFAQLTKDIPKELQPLAEEARKYKSAEEFANSQINAFHQSQSKTPFNKFLQKGDKGYKKASYSEAGEGIYFSPSKELVQSKYGKDGGVLVEAMLDMKKPLDLGEFDSMYFDGKKVNSGSLVTENFKREMNGLDPLPEPDIQLRNLTKKAKIWLRKNGYDSLEGQKGEMWSAPEYVVLDKSQVRTKQQLIDLWNKANGKKGGFADLGFLPKASIGTVVATGALKAGVEYKKSKKNDKKSN